LNRLLLQLSEADISQGVNADNQSREHCEVDDIGHRLHRAMFYCVTRSKEFPSSGVDIQTGGMPDPPLMRRGKLRCLNSEYHSSLRMSGEEPEGLNLKQKPKPTQKQNNPKTTPLR
jgi:hypothetical protein